MAGNTIFAVASGAGRGAITVMRISGPASGNIVSALAGAVPVARRASLRRLRGSSGELLDEAMVLWLPGPGSYTGEDSAELHLHGGAAVRDGVAAELVELGARPAEPGEFTRRAFLNGRMDLLEAEAIGDLVAAETEAQRIQALRQLEGELGAIYRGWADRLLEMLARREALIDFPDEDLPESAELGLEGGIEALRAEVAVHLADGHRGERLREGLVFAVVGRPNVGKSSLVNTLTSRDVAIVSPVPGTTRDALESRVVLGGVPVTLIDTAGLRETRDAIEAEGVRRARARAAEADLVIGVVDSPDDVTERVDLVVANKSDLGWAAPERAVPVSALLGTGIAELHACLAAKAREMVAYGGPPALTRPRHRAALIELSDCLGRAAEVSLPELQAEDLRQAVRALGRITGSVGVEDVLDSVFAQFCIGK